jgi:hypothetical protein
MHQFFGLREVRDFLMNQNSSIYWNIKAGEINQEILIKPDDRLFVSKMIKRHQKKY